jgi:two-component system, LuxR family, response regulator FixJ
MVGDGSMSQDPLGKKNNPVVYVIDDEDGMRQAITAVLETAGLDVLAFGRPASFLKQYDPARPGCLVLDVRMPEMSGLEMQQHLNRCGAMVPVILVSGHGDIPIAVQAMKDGAFDFLQKPFRGETLVERIRAALKQDAANRTVVERRAELQDRFDSLTPREREVLALVVDGKANKVIAMDLGLSERTVEIHRANLMLKVGARSVAHLVKMNLSIQGNR